MLKKKNPKQPKITKATATSCKQTQCKFISHAISLPLPQMHGVNQWLQWFILQSCLSFPFFIFFSINVALGEIKEKKPFGFGKHSVGREYKIPNTAVPMCFSPNLQHFLLFQSWGCLRDCQPWHFLWWFCAVHKWGPEWNQQTNFTSWSEILNPGLQKWKISVY